MTVERMAEGDIPAVVEMAGVIWREHYPGIIAHEQIEYMLARMYAPEVIRTEMADGVCWVKAMHEGALVLGLPRGRRRDGDDLAGASRAGDGGERPADEDGAVHGGGLQHALPAELILAQTHGLLLLGERGPRMGIVDARDQEAHRVRADVEEADALRVATRRGRGARHGAIAMQVVARSRSPTATRTSSCSRPSCYA